jgi:hypothetical protein
MIEEVPGLSDVDASGEPDYKNDVADEADYF